MARNIQQSLSDLGRDLASLGQSTAQFNNAAANMAALFNSRAFKNAAKTVGIQQRLESTLKLRDRVRDIIEAKDAMAAQPNRWKSTHDYLKERDELKAHREQVANRKKGRAFAFAEWHNRQYGNIPNALRDRIRQFGGRGGGIAFEQDFADTYNSEFDPKTYQYEQDIKTWGRNKADVLRAKREENDRRENKYRYARLQASRRRDEREKLYSQAPWMKSLVQSGVIDKKFIPQIAKGVNKLTALKSGAGVAGAIVTSIVKGLAFVGKSWQQASIQNQRIRDLAVLGGNKNYSRYGFALGMNEAQTVQGYQRLQSVYGPAATDILKVYAEGARGASAYEKQLLAESMGLSTEDVNMALLMSGDKKFTDAHGQSMAQVGTTKMLRDWRSEGLWKGESKFSKFASVASGAAAAYLGENTSIGKALIGLVEIWDGLTITEKMQEEQKKASRSADFVVPTGDAGGTDNSSTNINAPITINISGDADPNEIETAVTNGLSEAIRRQSVLDGISPEVKV